jgi:DNA repair exonuclease SbcCD ATPase subunit
LKGLDDSHGADQEAIGRLHEQVQALQQELSDTLVVVENLKGQMQQKEEVQDTVEELTRENQQSLDGEINKLRTELTNVQVAKSETEADYKKRVQGLEDMIDSMQVEIDETLEEKEREVEDLKLKVEDKEARINRLTKEKEQLVLSMNDMTSSRRDEIDELQSELMGMSTRAANQAREVQSFKLQIEESSYRKEEIERLRSRVRDLTDQLSSRDGTRMHERTALEVENSELRQRLRQASLERQSVEDKMREYVSEQKGGSSRSVQVLRERNAALKFEVEKLTKKLRKVAVQKHVVDSKAASSKAASTNVEAIRFMI